MRAMIQVYVMIMKSEDIIVGVEKTLEEVGDSWNRKRLRWLLTHHTPRQTRQHCVQLDMVLLSSERVVSVDGNVKLKQMCSFGFKCDFPVSDSLQASIQQDGLDFELFLNGKSFTQCTKLSYSYQPPPLPLDQDEFKPHRLKKQPSKQPKPTLSTPGHPTGEKQKVEKQKEVEVKREGPKAEQTEKSIKDMQSQAMKILIQQKKEKQARLK